MSRTIDGPMMPRAVLFDLDETLLDRQRAIATHAVAFTNYYSDHLDLVSVDGVAHVLREAAGGGYIPKSEMFGRLLARLPWKHKPIFDDFNTQFYATFPRCSVLASGAMKTLEDLREVGIQLGVITNGSLNGQSLKIDTVGIRHLLGTVITSGETGLSKPDPRIFHVALESLGVSPDQAWFVGDHPVNDIVGASSAGLTPVWIRGFHDWPAEYPEPKHPIDGLEELMNLLTAGRSFCA